MHLSTLEWFLIGVVAVGQLAVLATMVMLKYRIQFPFFFNFILFNLLWAAANPLFVYLKPIQYFYVYWIASALSTFLAFGVLYEVFIYILKPYSALVDLGRLLFRWAILFLAMASVFTAIATTGSQSTRICGAIQHLSLSAQLMQCGLLMLLLLFEKRLGVSWRSPSISIMLGIGTMAALDLSGSYIRLHIANSAQFMDILNSVVWAALACIWCANFAMAKNERRTFQNSPTRLILQRWNEGLMSSPLMNNQFALSPVDSFLPGVEKTVDRVLARKMSH